MLLGLSFTFLYLLMLICTVVGICNTPQKPCSHMCREISESPGYVCDCPSGMSMGSDGKTCDG